MIKDLKELQALLKLCRKQGVTDITLDGLSIKFGELSGKAGQLEDTEGEIPTESLTPEQLMFYSVQGAEP